MAAVPPPQKKKTERGDRDRVRIMITKNIWKEYEKQLFPKILTICT